MHLISFFIHEATPAKEIVTDNTKNFSSVTLYDNLKVASGYVS